MIQERNGNRWVCCPKCGKSIHKIIETTTANDMLFWCKKCRKEFVLNINAQH